MGEGRNIEETSSVYIAIMLMIFVAFSKLVESIFRYTKQWLHSHHEISLVAVLEHIKDEVMLVGTLSMVLLIAESWFASWCVPEDTQYVPALSQDYCKTIYNFSNASLSLTSKHNSGRRLSATMRKRCPAGQTYFMDTNALHQVDFLIFWMAFTHIIYSICVVLLSRFWAYELVKWEKEILSAGKSFADGVASEEVKKPANIFEEYFAAFKQQFTHFRAKGMDAFTAAALRQFYIISQKKDQNYRFFSIVKEELEQDFDEICGIDSVLWLFTAFSLFTEGQGSSGAVSDIPMAGTIFVMILSLVIGTNLMVIIQRLILDIYSRMLSHGYTSPISLASKKDNADEEKASQVGDSILTEDMFEKPTPVKADMGLFGHGKFVWLWGIKFCMFEFSRKVTYIIFYYQQFRNEDGVGGQSCYHLSRAANGGISVYLSLVCCFMFIFYIGLKLIPMYSISTHVAMHQRKISYMHKLARGMHKINAAHHLAHGSHHGHGHSSADHSVKPTGHDNVSRSKYVVSESTFDTHALSDHEHMMQQHSEHTSEEESHDHDADDVLPDTMVG